MATFNGWTIVPTPTSPAAPQTMEITATDVVAVSKSPFTGQTQTQDWQTAWLEASASMPPLVDADARAWEAFLLSLRGQLNVFQMGDPLKQNPLGTGAGSPVVSGSGQSGFTLNITGFSGADALLPGDYFQIGYRLYRNLSIVGAGAQTLNIWPNIRESPASGTAIQVFNCQGLWRLKGNPRKWSLPQVRYVGMQFDMVEAL